MNDARKNSISDPRAAANRDLRIRVVDSIGAISAATWDACANPNAETVCSAGTAPPAQDLDQEIVCNPFISHSFLSALEESHSVGGRSGWHVQHLLVTAADGELIAAAPCYLKSHSRGEYVFDRGWAEAYERAGGECRTAHPGGGHHRRH